MKIRQKKQLIEELKQIDDLNAIYKKALKKLYEVLFVSLFGLLKGNTTFEQLHDWMEFNKNNDIFLKLFNKNVLEIPSQSTLHRILININNNEFDEIFRKFFQKYVTKENIAVDGKWLKGSDINGQYENEKHKSVLNILDKETKIVIGHKFLECGKKSEISAFKEILDDKSGFCKKGQIFSFDALSTQEDILNKINERLAYYLAKVKGNQKNLRQEIIDFIKKNPEPTDIYKDTRSRTEGNKEVQRIVEIFQNESCDIVLFNPKFAHIETIIKLTKITYDPKTKERKTKIEYLISNLKTTAKHFKNILLQHWRVETYHYHLDKLTKEDDHLASVNPFSFSILRSFTINFYQLFLNIYKGQKIIVEDVQTKKPLTMARIKRYSEHSDLFVSELLEI